MTRRRPVARRRLRPRVPDAIEGTHGLLLGTGILLLAAMLEPGLPADFPRWLYTVPAMALLVVGLGTVPREGLAAQERALGLAAEKAWRPMLRRLPWVAVAVVLLLPRLFLGAYGVPHLNPLVGIVPQQWVVRLATVFLFAVLLAPILYLRSGRRHADHAEAMTLPEGDPRLRRQDVLLAGTYLLAVVWGLLLRPFWTPFSLLQWPPELWSLDAGARGVAALAFAVVPPVVLFMAFAAHMAALRRLAYAKRGKDRDKALAATGAHVVLLLTAAFLHGYNLLWIARYENLAQF